MAGNTVSIRLEESTSQVAFIMVGNVLHVVLNRVAYRVSSIIQATVAPENQNVPYRPPQSVAIQ